MCVLVLRTTPSVGVSSALPRPSCPSQYDEYKTPMDNIGMQDSLLSRFDLIFIVLDEVSHVTSSCNPIG